MPKSSTLSDAVAREEEVLRLDVAVDDALGVRGGEHVEELVGEASDLDASSRCPLALPARLERLALEQLHDEEDGAVLGDVVVEDATAPRVLDACWRRSPRAGSAR